MTFDEQSARDYIARMPLQKPSVISIQDFVEAMKWQWNKDQIGIEQLIINLRLYLGDEKFKHLMGELK